MGLDLYQVANRMLEPCGLHLCKRRLRPQTMKATLARLQTRGFRPRLIFDGGACRGEWSRMAQACFPEASFVLFEPNPELQPQLGEVCAAAGGRMTLRPVALGHAAGSAELKLWYAAGAASEEGVAASSLLAHATRPSPRTVTVCVSTLAEEERLAGRPPNLLKLDLQGGELAALAGAGELTAATEVIIVEFAMPGGYRDRPHPTAVLTFLAERGYLLDDFVELSREAGSGRLWGGDFVLVHRDSPLHGTR